MARNGANMLKILNLIRTFQIIFPFINKLVILE